VGNLRIIEHEVVAVQLSPTVYVWTDAGEYQRTSKSVAIEHRLVSELGWHGGE
jgi:hypothetical protein